MTQTTTDTTKDERIESFLIDVSIEVKRAMSKHAPMHSLHEAYAVILEEVDEFKAEVWKKQKERDTADVYTELVHIAAMVARCVADCAGDGFHK
jgi:hypothetical protein